jgi:Bifunctional DNA primase/polymerase, N-terminal
MQRETTKGKASGAETPKAKKSETRKQQHNASAAAKQVAIPHPKPGAPVIDWARYYIWRGLTVVPVPYREKGPIITGWQKLTITLDNVGEYFPGQMNIGAQQGPRSGGLVDGDLDCTEAEMLADWFLPDTEAIFGRASKPRSHRLYRCDDPEPKAAETFNDENGGIILELRFGGGGKGAQTVFPGSVHKDSGESIEWHGGVFGEITDADSAKLIALGGQLACAALLLRHWPARGSRHFTALNVGGLLARAGWERDDVANLVRAVCTGYGSSSTEVHVKAALDSFDNTNNGDPTYGLPNLRKLLNNEAAANKIAEHAGYRDDGSELLQAYNEKFCVLPIGGKTSVVKFGKDPDFPGYETIVSSSTLKSFKDLYNKYIYRYHDRAADKAVAVRHGTWWLSHPGRRQYDGGMRFMPTHDEQVVDDTLNLWRSFAVQPRKPEGTSGAKGCSLFLGHAHKIICSGNDEHYDYLIKREAFIARRRTRSEIALGLHTIMEGTGKGFYCRELNHLYGTHAMQVQNPEHVIGRYNPHLEKLLRLTADEALFALDPRHRNALYNLITEPHLTIEPKFVNVYKAANYLNIDVISNAEHFIPVSGTARRFMVPTVSVERANDHKYFAAVHSQLANDGGYEALLYHLLHEIDIRDFNVRAVPKTAALREQIEYSRKGVDLLVEEACNLGRVPCTNQTYPHFSDSSDYGQSRGFDYFIDHHPDLELRRLGSLKVKRRLAKQWGCVTGDSTRKQVNRIKVHGVIWPPLNELRAKFVEKYGEQVWLCPDIIAWQSPQISVHD